MLAAQSSALASCSIARSGFKKIDRQAQQLAIQAFIDSFPRWRLEQEELSSGSFTSDERIKWPPVLPRRSNRRLRQAPHRPMQG